MFQKVSEAKITRAAALRRESMAKKQNTKSPPFASKLLKKISISAKDIRLEKI